MTVTRFRFAPAAAAWLVCALLVTSAARVEAAQSAERCLAFEFYYRSGDAKSESALRVVEAELADRRGIQLRRFDLAKDASRVERLRKIATYFKLEPEATPFLYACNQAVQGYEDDAKYAEQIRGLMRMEVFVRAGCPRCARAKDFLAEMAPRYPGLDIVYFEVTSDPEAARYVQQLARDYGQGAASVPVFHYCRQLTIGFDSARGTGSRIESVLNKWSHECRQQDARPQENDTGAVVPHRDAIRSPVAMLALLPLATTGYLTADQPHAAEQKVAWEAVQDRYDRDEEAIVKPANATHSDEAHSDEAHSDEAMDEELLPLPLPLPEDATADAERDDVGTSAGDARLGEAAASESDGFDVPMLGYLSASEVGLPVFTIVIGLVDGFNPCAMWVLMFLLSILVNLRSRTKILAVAGTFVLISGVIYFAFMAAWLSVFQWIGLLRPVQITLAVIAITVGLIHIKDFFAFHKGVTLSIPEAAKPGIYARVRRVVTAENLLGAIFGASVLAVMVNFIELLCTAGLPALYTQILAVHQLPAWLNYSFLALYNVAYMFDDAFMVALVVITLSKTKMQEQHGRVLKLVSGALILVLGTVMLVKPEWLV